MPSSNICQFRQSAYFCVFCQSLAAKQPSRLPNRLCQWRNAIAPAVIVIFASPSLMCYRHWSSLAQHAYCAQSTNKWRLVWQWEIRPRRRTKRGVELPANDSNIRTFGWFPLWTDIRLYECHIHHIRRGLSASKWAILNQNPSIFGWDMTQNRIYTFLFLHFHSPHKHELRRYSILGHVSAKCWWILLKYGWFESFVAQTEGNVRIYSKNQYFAVSNR